MSGLRHGLVGYGTGGRYFHAPFIDAAEGIVLAGIVARDPERIAQARGECPGVPIFSSLSDLIASGIDALTITTPPETHEALGLEAIQGGVHLVIDKPFAPTAAIARNLFTRARDAGVVLSAYQNRRWDADIRTLAVVLHGGDIGVPWRVTSRMDQANPATIRAGTGNGVLLDLGSHLVDQMIWLLGPVAAVTAHLAYVGRDGQPADAACALDMIHVSGVTSYVETSKAHHVTVRELRACGSLGTYAAESSDVQWLAIESGLRPADDPDSWGFETPSRLGTLSTVAGRHSVDSEQGRWHDFYTAFAEAVVTGGDPPVTGEEAVHLLEVLEAARASARSGRTVELAPLTPRLSGQEEAT